MLPGFLHLDLRRGLSAEMINAALLGFFPDTSIVSKAFSALGMPEISFELCEHNEATQRGFSLNFYAHKSLIKSSKPELLKVRLLEKAQSKWDGPHEPITFVEESLGGLPSSFQEIENLFFKKNLSPSVLGLLKSIFQALATKDSSPKLAGPDALWFLCQIYTLAVLIDALDPKFITATNIVLPQAKVRAAQEPNLSLNDESVIRQILSGQSTREIEEDISCDIVAAAFVKALLGHCGPRSESVVLDARFGFSPRAIKQSYVEALWCEAALPSSMAEIGPSQRPSLSHLHELSGLVALQHDASQVVSMLSLHGARSISFHLVHGERGQSYHFFHFVVGDERKREAIEAFLIKAGAKELCIKAVEFHCLNKRLISVPLGKGNKINSLRFHEYLYLDKILRAEPLQEDLDRYVQKNNYSYDVARADLYMAWKKWRNVAVEDSE
jgi:hypothetical protein